MQNFTITAFYATGRPRYHATNLADWTGLFLDVDYALANEDADGWVPAYTLTITARDGESLANVAEIAFNICNESPTWRDEADFFGNEKSHVNARSMSVGDAVRVSSQGVTGLFGVDSCGWRNLEVK